MSLKREPRQERVITARDGARFSVYAFGAADAPPVAFINALGMQLGFCRHLIEALAEHYNVVTWKPRGVPIVDGDFTPAMADFDRHLDDLHSVLQAFETGPAHLVGWCAGARVALEAACKVPRMVGRVVCLNGAFSTAGQRPMTVYEKNLRSIVPRLAKNRAYAEFYHRAVFGRHMLQSSGGISRMGAEIIQTNDAEIREWASEPFNSPEALYRYALLQDSFLSRPLDLPLEQLEAEVLVVTGLQDQIAHPAESREIAARLPRGSLIVQPAGTHYALYDDPNTITAAVAFLLATDATGGQPIRATEA